MTVYTMGSRSYAKKITEFLDPDKKFFANRILSREDGFDQNFKTPALKSLFPHKTSQLVIIDDREDIWNNIANLIPVSRYVFFHGVTDLNATQRDRKHQEEEEILFEDNKNYKVPSLSELDDPPEEISKSTEDAALYTFSQKQREVYPQFPQLFIANTPKSVLKKELTKAIASCTFMAASLTDEYRLAWRKKGMKRILSDLSKILFYNFDHAVVQLRACRLSFGPDEYKTFGSSEKDDFPILWNLLFPSAPLHDPDDVLFSLYTVLENVHFLYYETFSHTEEADCGKIIPQLKGDILAGITILFSGVFPKDSRNITTNELMQNAIKFGAKITDVLDETVTHVLGMRTITTKIQDARRLEGIKIVHVNWLRDCIAHWKLLPEAKYQLFYVPVGNTSAREICSSNEMKQKSCEQIEFVNPSKKICADEEDEHNSSESTEGILFNSSVTESDDGDWLDMGDVLDE
ncbi:RNA polymerase II subunit A C-terminal domain phosphatase-like [Zophobas morio]|uniref:RNA polymerase II subunit A C-terminal domain phosphatase-like n=1 Tax=Zophobas morio TaxID=2755281 RepID=UPI00308398C5